MKIISKKRVFLMVFLMFTLLGMLITLLFNDIKKAHEISSKNVIKMTQIKREG